MERTWYPRPPPACSTGLSPFSPLPPGPSPTPPPPPTPRRLAVRVVDASGAPLRSLEPALSPQFIVTTTRVKGNVKPAVPLTTDPGGGHRGFWAIVCVAGLPAMASFHDDKHWQSSFHGAPACARCAYLVRLSVCSPWPVDPSGLQWAS